MRVKIDAATTVILSGKQVSSILLPLSHPPPPLFFLPLTPLQSVHFSLLVSFGEEKKKRKRERRGVEEERKEDFWGEEKESQRKGGEGGGRKEGGEELEEGEEGYTLSLRSHEFCCHILLLGRVSGEDLLDVTHALFVFSLSV